MCIRDSFKLKYEEYPSVNVHLGDSLLTLSYLVNHPKGESQEE